MNEPQIEPGRQLSRSELEAIAKDNERISKEAAQRAKDQMQEDIRMGKRPVGIEVAESIKKQLEEKFGD